MRIFPAVEKVFNTAQDGCALAQLPWGWRSQGRYDGWAFPSLFLHTLISENCCPPSKRQFRLAG